MKQLDLSFIGGGMQNDTATLEDNLVDFTNYNQTHDPIIQQSHSLVLTQTMSTQQFTHGCL